jgi:hypothetical protein
VTQNRLLPWLIGALCLAQVVVGSIAGAGIRDDHRKAAAIAKEKRDVAAFHTALMPIALGVFDTVQPLQDVLDETAFSQPYFPQLRNDVLDRSGAAAGMAALNARLTKVAVPHSRRASMASFQKGMTELVSATKLLAAATHAKGDRAGYVKAFGPAFDSLTTGSSLWVVAVTDEFGTGKVPSPSSKRYAAAGRRTSTKGGYVLAADRVCGAAFVSMDALPNRQDPIAFVRDELPQHVVINDRVFKGLRAIAIPRDAPTKRISTMLSAVSAFAQHERALVAAQKAQDGAVYDAAYRTLIASLPALRDLSHAFGEYGATVCRDYLDVTDLLAPSGSDAKPDLST